jgi:ElaB/YqjD/DUF883 family membrane-anchored ribosome-binding protein
MTHHTDRIQEQLEEARARTRRDIDDLQTRAHERTFLDEGISALGGTDLRLYAERAGKTLLRQVQAHPLPSALIGAGLAMMATGGTRLAQENRHESDWDRYDPYADDRAGLTEAAEHQELEALYGTEWRDAHRTMTLAEETERLNRRRDDEDAVAYQTRLYDAYGRALEIERNDNEDDTGFRKRIDDSLNASRRKVDDFRNRFHEHRQRTGQQVRGAYDRSRAGLQSAYGSASRHTRETAASAQAGVRSAVSQSRYAAQDAAHSSKEALRTSAHRTEDFITDNPFAAGGIALLAGLAAGSFFRMTEREERALSGVATAVDDQARQLNAKANEKVREYAEEVERVAKDVRSDLKTEEPRTTA